MSWSPSVSSRVSGGSGPGRRAPTCHTAAGHGERGQSLLSSCPPVLSPL